jgi:ATP-dependent Clp protease protease subunit
MIIPTIIEKTFEGERHYDIYSRLLNERIILLTGEIDDQVASVVIAELLYLVAIDENKDIQLYINSPGGSVSAGLAIYDTMRSLSCDVSTICVGMCASMGAFLLCGGTKGKRYALKNSEIMIHQPLGGGQGPASDVEIMTRRLLQLKVKLNNIMAENTGQTLEKINYDTDRDYFMSPHDAVEYGLIDHIIEEKVKSIVTK